ncbi:TRAP transporter small permease [Celeribacter baekdonensis]|jgi:TRAP-type C4-dicarboxylate transport system permease small subunit|uniref:TRAP transporter small permease n=1 Tax=Celeribacter baekdonensis TaxID=875171 RepID=UPI0020C806AB|nr:TRAP transporter small permease [Celeribacter baekdonensis]|tara:strand:- start:5902 stop:6429 length:528 start_codon:yes stop_codon:yes gene_type:complete
MLARLNRLLDGIARITSWVALSFLAFMMVAITLDVVARALFGRAVPGLFEMTEMSMVMVVFMGLGATLLDDGHIRVTMMTDALPGPWSRVCTSLAWLFAGLTFAMLAWPATQEAIYSFSIREFRWGYFQVPIWWAKIAVAAGLWFAALQAAVHALRIALKHVALPTLDRVQSDIH